MTNVTRFLHKNETAKKWVLIDAKGQSIGRVATVAAKILQGKDKPNYTPNVNMGDNVIIINSAKVKVTGGKLNQKLYYRHSGYVGNMKVFTLHEILSNKPEYAMQKAVRLMLPKNRLASKMLKGLRVFAEDSFPKELRVERIVDIEKREA